MTVTITQPPSGVLLTIADVQRWEGDVRRLDEEISRLTASRAEVKKMLDAASLFVGRVTEPTIIEDESATPKDNSSDEDEVTSASDELVLDGIGLAEHLKESTWAGTVLDIVKPAEMGLTYAEVREAVLASSLAPKLRRSDKGYHNAIGRLARSGILMREHGRLFTPEAYERFKAAVAAGEMSAVVPQPFVHSPMGEAILRVVQDRPGIIGKAIIGELRKDAEFNATLTPHETGAYNIIARLVKRRQIVRRDDGGCVPGPDFPRHLIGRKPERDEALNGYAVSASVINNSQKGGDGYDPATT